MGILVTPLFLFVAIGLAAFIVRCMAGAIAKHPLKMCVLRSVPCWRLVALLPLAVVCTILAFRKEPPLRTDPDPPSDPEAELRFSSITVTSNSVTLEVAWPTNMFPLGTTLDLFTAPTLTSRWEWVEATATAVSSTSNVFSVSRTDADTNGFFRVSDRSTCALTMSDADCDGIPDVYELANDTNPYVPDYAVAPKILAGVEGGASNLAAALSASVPYSIIEIAPGVHEGAGWTGLHLPSHPVLITSPDGGRSRACTLRDSWSSAVFYLSATQRTETVVQGLNIDLLATSNIQVAFWCGGNTAWSGLPAAGTFRNISIRMPNPGVDYRGWFIRHWESNEVVIASCIVNAAGATRVRGIAAVDSPPMSVENCTFVNFPPAASPSLGYGVQYESTAANSGGAPERIPVEIVNCVFDSSFINAYALAPLEAGVDYEVTMMNGIVPSPLEYGPDVAIDVCVTNALVSWSGHLLAGSPAIDFGTDALRSSFDVDGQYRVGRPDAGADERIDLGVIDTDGDGLADADEIDIYGTDPFRADSDFDGDSDGFEIATGTDHVNPASYPQILHVSVTNTVSSDIASYVAWGFLSEGWEANGLVELPSGSGTVAYTNDAMLGVAYVKAFSDINGNGAYDEGVDLILLRHVTHAHSADMSFKFGDMDGDGFSDALERAEGTDPCNASNYCFSLSATFIGVFHTTNSLTAAAKMANEVCIGPILATNTTFTLEGHVVTTNGGPLVVYFWDDANSNGLREATEAMVSAQIAVTGHEVCVTNRLSRGVFDSDGDGMLDWWEIAHGLSPTNSADALVDDDGDTLLNLHEFYSNTDPHDAADATNTLIYSLIHSIDDRLAAKTNVAGDTMRIYQNYDNTYVNDSVIFNTNAWTYGLDFSPVGVRLKRNGTFTHGLFPTLISERHIIFATHCGAHTGDVYRFRTPSGEFLERTLIGIRNCRNYSNDVMVGILNQPLPSSIQPVRFLPENYEQYIGRAERLPSIRVNQWSRAVVQEIKRMPSITDHSQGTTLSVVDYRISDSLVREQFRVQVEMNDSGHPNFLVHENSLVFLFPTHSRIYGWQFGTSCLSIALKNEIESMMNELCEDNDLTNRYSVVEFDFEDASSGQ